MTHAQSVNHLWNRHALMMLKRNRNLVAGFLPTFSQASVGMPFYVAADWFFPHSLKAMIDKIGYALGMEFVYTTHWKAGYIRIMRVL